MSGAKVVGIHGGSTGGREAKPLPQPLVKLRELTKQHLHTLLRKLFDGADDALFAMADKAGTNNEQTVYFDAMRELRLQKKHIATAVVKSAIRSFNEVGYYRAKYIEATSGQTNADELSLIQNEDLEIKVAVDGMVNRLRGNAAKQLDALHQRVSALIPPLSIDVDQIPAGPEALCDGFMDGCAELDIDIRAQIVVFKLFERFVLNDMAKAYEDSNTLLVQLGVMPTVKTSASRRSGAPKQAGPNAARTRQTAAPNAPYQPNHPNQEQGQQHESLPLGEGAYFEAAPGNTGEAQVPVLNQLDDLRNLLHGAQARSSAQSSASVPTLSNVFYSQHELISALSGFQTEQVEQLGHYGSNQLIDYRALLNQRLGQESCEADYSEVDSDVINLVSMLFEFILDDRQVQPAMKALIARLQIPILKVALVDRNFFNKGGHPARKLLNLIASAALGWNEPEEGKVDRLKDKIEVVVQSVIDNFDQDVSLFSLLLEDFERFLDVEKRRGQLVEQRTKDSEKGKAANELARKAAQDALNESIGGRVLPENVKTLLSEAWSSVMVLHYLKEGEQGKSWLRSCTLVDELLWSLNPEPIEDGTRVKLLQLIPELMRGLRAGLKDVSFDEFKAKALLKPLEDLHVEALHALQDKLSELESAQVAEPEPASSEMTQRQRELAEQEDALAELVRSTMELEMDFKNLKSAKGDERSSARSESSVSAQTGSEVLEKSASERSVQQSTEPRPSSETGSSSQDSEQQVAQHSEPEEIVLVSVELEPELGSIDANDPFLKQVEKFAVGCWFEFQSGEHTERCKLAAVIKATGKYIFVNRSGVKVAEKTKMGLSVELRRGTVQILNDGLLFDRALESIITNLRGRNSEA